MAIDGDVVGVGPELDVVLDADRRDEETVFAGQLLAQGGDAVEQGAATVFVDEGNEAVADLDADAVGGDEVLDLFFLFGFGFLGLFGFLDGGLLALALSFTET